MGYPSTALWWPALFPARPELPVATIPGLGTPDIRGQLGVGTYLTTEPSAEGKKVRVGKLEAAGKGTYQGCSGRAADQDQRGHQAGPAVRYTRGAGRRLRRV